MAQDQKTVEALPKIASGTVHARFVRCNRAGCRCASGRLHGPYFYRFWREAGRLRKEYVPRAQLDAVRAACAERQALVRDLRASRRLARLLTDNLRPGKTQ